MSFVEKLEKIQVVAEVISSNRYLKAVSKGMVMTVPATITGSLLTLLSNLPIEGYQNFLTNTGLKTLLQLPGIFTSNIMGLIVVYFVASQLAKSFKIDTMMPGILGIISFLILTPLSSFEIPQHDTVRMVDFISFDYIGSKECSSELSSDFWLPRFIICL